MKRSFTLKCFVILATFSSAALSFADTSSCPSLSGTYVYRDTDAGMHGADMYERITQAHCDSLKEEQQDLLLGEGKQLDPMNWAESNFVADGLNHTNAYIWIPKFAFSCKYSSDAFVCQGVGIRCDDPYYPADGVNCEDIVNPPAPELVFLHYVLKKDDQGNLLRNWETLDQAGNIVKTTATTYLRKKDGQ